MKFRHALGHSYVQFQSRSRLFRRIYRLLTTVQPRYRQELSVLGHVHLLVTMQGSLSRLPFRGGCDAVQVDHQIP